MENKLYYKDAYIKEFQTKVLIYSEDMVGKYVVLEETAFYPTGGGQPHDIGTLNGVAVTNVVEVDGEVRHYIDSPSLLVGDTVNAKIDWERRFDHMQQHTGQHILTAAFVELLQLDTLSFHLGTETATIDIDASSLSEDQVKVVEKRANEVILENRPIETKWIGENDIGNYPLRKAPSVVDNIRLVIIPDYDYNGCGGTHPKTTGEVMAIKILQWEKQNKKLRIHFVCGNRVLYQLQQKHQVLTEITQMLSAPEEKVTKAVHRLITMTKELEKTLQEKQTSLLDLEGEMLLNRVMEHNGKEIVFKVLENRTMQDLQKLGKFLVNKGDRLVVLLVSENGEQIQMVCGRGANMDLNMKELLTRLLPLVNGRGGGTPAFSQGGGTANLSGKDIVEHAMTIIDEIV